jgi:hypothetical protein
LLFVGDKIIRVEHVGIESKVLVWKLGKDVDGEWQWNFEHEERMYYEPHQLPKGAYIVINNDPN